MIFVEKARDKKVAGVKLEAAVSQAVDECISEGILSEFFREHRKEIVEMGVYEFDQEVYERILREDGEAIGIEKGIEIGKSQGIEIGKNQGMEIGREEEAIRAIESLMDTLKLSVEQAMAALKVPEEDWSTYVSKISK